MMRAAIGWFGAAALAALLSGCVSVNVEAPNWLLPELIGQARVVDLTYGFGADTIYWPTARGFELQEVSHGPTEGGYWYEANNICMAEHGGTHMDAPVHFAEGQLASDQVPVAAGIGALVRVDVSERAANDADYRLSVDDLRAWEERHGRIPAGAIVVMYSAWGRRWPDRASYLGTAEAGDTANLHFPGFSAAAAAFLVEQRDIKAIGVDTPSIDHGPSRDFMVHRIVHGAGKPAFENLANLNRVPPAGATILALPMKIKGGSGGPLRAVALLP